MLHSDSAFGSKTSLLLMKKRPLRAKARHAPLFWAASSQWEPRMLPEAIALSRQGDAKILPSHAAPPETLSCILMTDSAGRLANRLIIAGHMHRKRLAASLPPESKYGACPVQYFPHFQVFGSTFHTSSCILMTDSAGQLANRLIISGHMHRKRLAASLPPESKYGACPV